MAQASDDSSNTIPTHQTKAADLTALAARLAEHADGIENMAAKAMADDMAAAARAIDKLIAGIRKAAAQTSDATTKQYLTDMLGGE